LEFRQKTHHLQPAHCPFGELLSRFHLNDFLISETDRQRRVDPVRYNLSQICVYSLDILAQVRAAASAEAVICCACSMTLRTLQPARLHINHDIHPKLSVAFSIFQGSAFHWTSEVAQYSRLSGLHARHKRVSRRLGSSIPYAHARLAVDLPDRLRLWKGFPGESGAHEDPSGKDERIPQFVEEMTKAMLEAAGEGATERTVAAIPSSSLAVPASLHASLMARLVPLYLMMISPMAAW
jgi:hypothetical protein